MDKELMDAAWAARERSYQYRPGTKVGCAIKGSCGDIFRGWNIQGQWMTSIHAELCAISQLVGSQQSGVAIAIASDARHFTPCGACLDWLMQFCEASATIVIGTTEDRYGDGELILKDLYPLYPSR